MNDTPDKVLNKSDPGDDVQRRFGFQATKAAMLSLSLLDPESEVEEVYCEQHEDILVKKHRDRFIGYQVKSKHDAAGPHKATDDEIVRSVQRFVEHERSFGLYFDRYIIGSNAGFWNDDKTVSSRPYLLSLVEKASNGRFPKAVDNFLKKVFPEPQKPSRKKKMSSADEETAPAVDPQVECERQRKAWEQNIHLGRTALRKLKLEKLPSLRDMRAALIEMLPKFDEIGDRLFSEVGVLADGLVAEMLKAARLEGHSARDRYLAVFNNPGAIETSDIIKGKRITKSRLTTLLESVLSVQPTLCTSTPISVADLPKGMSVLETKMAVGGISIHNVDLAKDLKASTEKLLLWWLHRDGKAVTDTRYQHLRTLVRSESQEVFDLMKSDECPFGGQMLDEVRHRLRLRHDREKSSFFGCSYEHLMGMAAILTEDCALWWSQPFEVPKREGAS